MINCCDSEGAGTQVAIEAADMVLIRNNLYDLVVALDLAKKVFSRVKMNFLWAIIYNAVMVPFAAGLHNKILWSANSMIIVFNKVFCFLGRKCSCRRSMQGWRWLSLRFLS